MKDKDRKFEISGELDRAEIEALYLEIRRLAGRHGVDLKDVRIEGQREETASA